MAFERRVLLVLLLLVGLRVVLYGNFNAVHSEDAAVLDEYDHEAGQADTQISPALSPELSPDPGGPTVRAAAGTQQGHRRGGGKRSKRKDGGRPDGADRAAGAAGGTPGKENKNVQEPTYVPKKKVPFWNVLNELRLVDSGIRLVLHKRQFIFYNATLRATTLRRYLEYFDGNQTTQYGILQT